MPDTTTPAAGRVAAGAAWLTGERGPDWIWLIDLSTLDIRDSCRCIGGQLFGDYDTMPLTLAQVREYGFQADYSASVTYAALHDAWRAEILRRRAEATPCCGESEWTDGEDTVPCTDCPALAEGGGDRG
jgi:hypothetical protein